MDGYQFEYQCAEILKRNGFSRVQVTQSSGDQGVDIIAHKHRKKYGIQCKYYSYPVGNKAVQEAYAGANFYDCDKAMVMTNLTFTRSATELAQKLEVELWDHCPTTRYYSLLFKLMSLMNIVFFLYGILLLFLLQNKSTVPFSLPGDFLTGTLLVAASVFGFLGRGSDPGKSLERNHGSEYDSVCLQRSEKIRKPYHLLRVEQGLSVLLQLLSLLDRQETAVPGSGTGQRGITVFPGS